MKTDRIVAAAEHSAATARRFAQEQGRDPVWAGLEARRRSMRRQLGLKAGATWSDVCEAFNALWLQEHRA